MLSSIEAREEESPKYNAVNSMVMVWYCGTVIYDQGLILALQKKVEGIARKDT